MFKKNLYRCAKCGNSITEDEVMTGCLHCKSEPTYKPSTFVKTFVYDYAEDLDNMVNRYAEDNELEIKSISICHTDVFVASVVFEWGVESGS